MHKTTDTPLPNIEDVLQARQRSGRAIRQTPLLQDIRLSEDLGVQVQAKAEHMQHTGSFKFRGIYHRVARLTPEQRAKGLITMSSGNAALALAMAAKIFECPATVVTFPDAAPTKIGPVADLGAEVVFGGQSGDELMRTCNNLVSEKGLSFVHPFDDADVIAGHGSMALEILESGETFDAILVPASGGGLLSATALVYKQRAPETRVIGVQPTNACGIFKSFNGGEIIGCDPDTIADGLRAQRPGTLNFELIQHYVDDVLLVEDEHIVPAMALAWNLLRIAIEPSAAVGLALLMTDSRFQGQKVAVVSTGCNVDLSMLATA